MDVTRVFESLGCNIEYTNVEKKIDEENIKGKQNIEELQGDEVEKKLNKKRVVKITKATRLACVKAGIIPDVYINTEYSIKKVKENNDKQSDNSKKHSMVNFDKYLEITSEILSLIRKGKKPNGSYILGAPNGLGKTSFVNTALMLMYQQGMRVVPYVSLLELAELKLETEKRIARGLSLKESNRALSENIAYLNDVGDSNKSKKPEMSYYDDIEDENYYKKPIVITGQFSFSEYLNSDVLFCLLSDISVKEIESNILKLILEIRGVKGLPTIVMTSNSLNGYKKNDIIGKYVWQEILSYDSNRKSYDRLEHISCFKTRDMISLD